MKLPSNEQAETALVAGLMSGLACPSDAAEACARVPVAAFSSARLGAIYEASRAIIAEQPDALDLASIIERLRATGKLERAGGAAGVAEVEEQTSSGANVRYWAGVVDEYHKRRCLIRASADASEKASDPTLPIGATLDGLGAALTSISSSRDDLQIQTLAEMVLVEFRAIEAAHSSDVEEVGVKTGFYDLDEMVGGLMPGELTILAGRPAMGKTSLALAFCTHAAEHGVPTLFFSLEMAKRQLVHRLIAMRSGISNQLLRRPKMMPSSRWPALSRAMGDLSISKLAIVDAPSINVMDIRAASRLCKAKHGLGLIVVDYLQLVRPVARGHSREREVAEVSENLKAISKELGVPVVCLAQLSRAAEQSQDRIPRLSHLRESGSIEQDADIVLFVHRPSYYDDGADKKLAEIFIAKHRHGPTGKIEAGWDEEKTLFYNRVRS